MKLALFGDLLDVVTAPPPDAALDEPPPGVRWRPAHWLLIEDGRITAIGPDALSKRSRPGLVRVLDASGCAVLPGFVQPHIHLCQTLFRGMADDLPLLDWLRERVWPLEAAHDERSLAASAELGLLELVLGGEKFGQFHPVRDDRQPVSARVGHLLAEFKRPLLIQG